MARILTSRFETGALASEPGYASVNGSPTVQTSVVKNGSHALQVSAPATYVRFFYAQTTAPVILGVWFRISGAPTIQIQPIWIESGGTPNAMILLNTDRTLQLRDSPGTVVAAKSPALTVDTWYYVELYAQTGLTSGGTITGRLNGTQFATTTTANTGSAGGKNFRLGPTSGSAFGGISLYYDDVALNDLLGPSNNSWPITLGTSTPRAEMGLATGGAPYFYGLGDIEHEWYTLDRAGAKYAKIDARWGTVEPTTKGTYDWSHLDMMFDAADTRGLTTIMSIDDCPTWANDGTPNHAPTDPADYADFCAAVATRYLSRGSGQVVFEIWNEPNYVGGWGGLLPPVSTYADMLKAAYPAIKAVDPDALVIAGSMASLDDNAGTHIAQETFLTGMYANGCKGYFDALSFHPYCDPQIDPDDGGVAPHDQNGWNSIDALRAILDANGDGDMPLWITEYGNFTSPGTSGITEAQQSAWMTSAFGLAKAQKNVAYFGIYSAQNDADASSDPQDNYGITGFLGATDKAAFAAFQADVVDVAAPVNVSAPVVALS